MNLAFIVSLVAGIGPEGDEGWDIDNKGNAN